MVNRLFIKKRPLRIVLSILFILMAGFLVLSLWPTSPTPQLIRKAKDSAKACSKSIRKDSYAILIDYDLPFFMNRLWIIDWDSDEVLARAHVSHAWRSGFWTPTLFSNLPGSRISSKGCFVTAKSYNGKFGLGMRLKGLETGKNHNVRRRAIVFHSSWGPWSSGCFMTLPWRNRSIIDLTKGGSFMYVHKS